MLPYWLLFGVFAVGTLFYKPWDREGRRATVPLLLALALMALFVGLRYEVGADWRAYLGIFEYSEGRPFRWLLRFGDPGFYWLVWVTHWLRQDIWLLNLLCASIFAIGLVAFARRQPNPWLVVAVAIPYLVIVVAMSGTRQATAIGFLLLALAAYSDGKIIRAAAWTAVGALFHASAIIMLGVLALSYSRNRLAAAVILMATLFVSYYVLSTSFDVYITRYANIRLQSEGALIRVLMNMVPALFYLAQPSVFKPSPQDHSLWRNMSILALLCLPVLYLVPSSTAIDRMSLYLMPLQLYVLGRLPHGLSKSREQYYVTAGLVLAYLALIIFVFFGYSLHGRYWLPYHSFWIF